MSRHVDDDDDDNYDGGDDDIWYDVIIITTTIIIIITRPKPARPSGIVGPRVPFWVFSTSHFAPAALSLDLNQPEN